jgi:hypothetical protein
LKRSTGIFFMDVLSLSRGGRVAQPTIVMPPLTLRTWPVT